MEEKISIFEYKEKNNSASFADIKQGVLEYDIINKNFIYLFKVRIPDLLRPHSVFEILKIISSIVRTEKWHSQMTHAWEVLIGRQKNHQKMRIF